VISNGKLISIKDGAVSALASEHLDMPFGVAVDAAGALYVSNRGKLQNVSVFSPQGKYLRSIGKSGGRPDMGRFDPRGMLEPAGMAIDGKGRLWVMECIDSPKRVSVWDAAMGTLQKEFFGGAHYSACIWMDSERPDEVYCDGALWKVDLDKRTSYPYSTVWRQRDPNSPANLSTHGGGLHMFTAKNGRQYGYATDGIYSKVLFMRVGDVFQPLLAFVSGHGTGGGGWKTEWIPYPATAKAFRDPTFNKKNPWGATLPWVDANNDGIMQPEEIGAVVVAQNFSCADRDLNLWMPKGEVYRPLGIEANGRPVYDFTKPEKVTFPCNLAAADPADGSLYGFSDNPPDGPKAICFARFQQGGKMLWAYRGGMAWFQGGLSQPPQQPGKIVGQTVLLGTAGDYCGFATYFGVHHLYTRDGICVGTVFRDPRTGGDLGADVIACENGNGQLVKPKGMNRYFALGGDQDGRITEVFGLDTVKRLPGGTLTITPADSKQVIDAFAAYQAKLARGQRLVIVRGRKALELAQPVTKTINASQSFQARTAYDEKNLYVLFEVTSPAPMVNGMTDPHLLFKGGNCLDIQFATDPNADSKREKPVIGDLRLLISRKNDKPVAVLYRPKLKDFKGQPVVFRTANVESFDSIDSTDRVALEYQQLTSGSFKAVATVPLAILGWQPQPRTKVQIDVGYIFGNNEGTKAMVRSYWSNNGFSAGVLNDVPNESKLVPKEWGMAEVE
jgi:hypothetical protein